MYIYFADMNMMYANKYIKSKLIKKTMASFNKKSFCKKVYYI